MTVGSVIKPNPDAADAAEAAKVQEVQIYMELLKRGMSNFYEDDTTLTDPKLTISQWLLEMVTANGVVDPQAAYERFLAERAELEELRAGAKKSTEVVVANEDDHELVLTPHEKRAVAAARRNHLALVGVNQVQIYFLKLFDGRESQVTSLVEAAERTTPHETLMMFFSLINMPGGEYSIAPDGEPIGPFTAKAEAWDRVNPLFLRLAQAVEAVRLPGVKITKLDTAWDEITSLPGFPSTQKPRLQSILEQISYEHDSSEPLNLNTLRGEVAQARTAHKLTTGTTLAGSVTMP